MAVEIVMPRFGWTMEEGLLTEWAKQDGDAVNVGDVLFTVESDKALNEVESFETGILRIPPGAPPAGAMVRVGALLAYVVQPGERAPFEAQPSAAALAAKPETAAVKATTEAAAASPPHSQPAPHATLAPTPTTVHPPELRAGEGGGGVARVRVSPRARRLAAALSVDVTRLSGSGRTGRIVERDVRAASQSRPAPAEVRASPLARRAAAELGVDLEQLAAARPGQRLERADVEAAAQRAAPRKSEAGAVSEQAVPVSPVRRLTAERMLAGAHHTAPVTLTTEVDATELVRLRAQLKHDPATAAQPIPSYADLMARLAAHALLEHPALNARLEGETIIQSSAIHIGLAVDTERGLLVPVVRDIQSKGLRQIAREAATLVERARAGRLSAEEMRGSTFTVTNLGMFEIDAFTPIINLPECAILGLGRIVPKQVVVDAATERVAIRQMMFLSLTFDHRLVDGAPAARCLQRIKQLVEQPYLWLVT
jgi:pyruvate dehydrogenase E2 component (dihydrolipoamide acetyltransferase)